MNLFLQYEVAFYWPWYVCFGVIAFCFGRWLGRLGLLPSVLIISALIVVIELRSVYQDMRERPELGRDADFVFWFGVLCRLIVYNLAFLPVGIMGGKLRGKHRHFGRETKSV